MGAEPDLTVVEPPNRYITRQNPDSEHDYPLQLGLDFINIIEKCVLPHTGSKGGSCMFGSYMGYNFTNVN
ncbi:hypothetical protein PSTT_02047 [Puccinia striiformis]|uniref:Uncharacterized protein n=1 Tax=Puccinia striiformis TaxID=27350 RepID=A0A2S4W106_9BASI|nr:hypothetical protein PSTT_02047 [Puccinia striiformis]